MFSNTGCFVICKGRVCHSKLIAAHRDEMSVLVSDLYLSFHIKILKYFSLHVRGVLGSEVKSCWLRITCLSPMWVWIPPQTLDSFLWGSYPSSLQTVGGSTQVSVLSWNNAQRGTWCSPVKLESHHIIFTIQLTLLLIFWCQKCDHYFPILSVDVVGSIFLTWPYLQLALKDFKNNLVYVK